MTVGTRVKLRTAMRASAGVLLKDFATARMTSLQTYPARPRSIYPPAAFVDKFSERMDYLGATGLQRHPVLELVVVHAVFDSADAAAQADAFIDEFAGYVADRFHAAGANTGIWVSGYDDDPNWIPDWLPPDQQKQFYATVISLEGLAQD